MTCVGKDIIKFIPFWNYMWEKKIFKSISPEKIGAMIQLLSKWWVLLTKGTGLFKYAAKLLVSILKDEQCRNNVFNNVFNKVYVLRFLQSLCLLFSNIPPKKGLGELWEDEEVFLFLQKRRFRSWDVEIFIAIISSLNF